VFSRALVLVGVVHIALSPMQDRARYANEHTHTHTHNDGGRTLKRRQLTIRCVATCAYVCVCAMSSGTKPLSLLDRLQQRRSTISLCAVHHAQATPRQRSTFVSALSPLSTLVCLCSLSLSLSLTVNDCVIRTQRDQSASQERISTVVALVSAAMPLTHRRQTAAVSRYTVAFKVLEDSVSGGAGDSSGFRGSAFTAPPGGGGGGDRCRPHSMSDARF